MALLFLILAPVAVVLAYVAWNWRRWTAPTQHHDLPRGPSTGQ